MIGSNSTQLNKLSGKMLNEGQCEGWKGLGYLYNSITFKRFCSIALIKVNGVIADGSCVPQESDYSHIRAVFPNKTGDGSVPIIIIDYPKYIQEEKTNTTLVVLFVSTFTKMQCDT